ncbi:hypothetical protein WICPIJ_001435 [Wickerhamomyces pijperi]|uniref:Pre-mRNA processing factor 4 (PRP4)-like domain-containing protein n=1 Tax=Wickerhamomyces pijperi TaxID=599730 RepID=A0A9P8TQS5_WICPI|nr:hypothetical protein WICPIJ_001435 [Wickerhamomyces pijperi]
MSNNTVSLDNLTVDTNYETSNGVKVSDFLQSLDLKRKQQLMLVPTDDEDVRQMLLKHNQLQQTSPDESKSDRRERLIQYIQQNNIDLSAEIQDQEMGNASDQEEDEDEEEFYTPASMELVEARKNIITYSSQRAKQRLAIQYKQSQMPMDQILPYRHSQTSKAQNLELSGSNLISSKPMSSVSVNPHNHAQLLAGTWNDGVYLLDQNLETTSHFSAPQGKISSISWNPTQQDRFIVPSHDEIQLFSTVDLSSSTATPMVTFPGHEDRIACVSHHPSGQYLASASFDKTWRLWDINASQELLLQESHSKEVFALDFNGDGQLLVSAGLDSIAYVWDLRGDKSISILSGHIRGLHCVKFRKNGYHIITGSSDGSIKVWDLRSQSSCLETIPAHKGLISSLGFIGDNDEIMYSCGFDGIIKFYSSDSWVKCSELIGHQGKIMDCQFFQDQDTKNWKGFSCGWDRDVKIWE